jgi:hypothetical protein
MLALASFETILQKIQSFDIWSVFLNRRDGRGMKEFSRRLALNLTEIIKQGLAAGESVGK